MSLLCQLIKVHLFVYLVTVLGRHTSATSTHSKYLPYLTILVFLVLRTFYVLVLVMFLSTCPLVVLFFYS